MARLKVGEIVIEDGKVSFGGDPGRAADVAPSPPTPATLRNGAIKFLRRIPGSPLLLAILGTAALIAGLTALWAGRSVYSGAIPDGQAVAYLLMGIPASASGVGLLTLSGLKRLLLPRPTSGSTERSTAPDLFEARMLKLLPLLDADSPSTTFERLVAETGMTEPALVETLSLAESRGILDEELNLETGEWYYRRSGRARAEAAAQEPRSIEDRQQALRGRRKEKTP